MHDGIIIGVGKVVKLVMVSLCITCMVHYAKRSVNHSSCLGLCMHINGVKSLCRNPCFTLAVILLLAGGVSIYPFTKTVFLNIRGAIPTV